ncbi:D-3-phosphoglycerate dehydrogenase [Catalinimonas alkaloidigena]|uniref:D-3-phosphoglycerate dehydrogenase n=1 Tax=Catalinimonas alkaloidigena TaxID=1075417 RepID=A0A1G8WFM9_9BACT|nr:NAD(P)-dependent oxidoreductase [Catalinimonas alkaloidigena]SDJ77108.1 D-3-phosphoglycerate dehydrogenase [Catalinimonas alkaloidigena]
MLRCLIIDQMHESIVPLLRNLGIEADYQPDYQRADLLASLPAYEGLIVRSKTRIDEEVLQHAEKLRFIGRAGAGLDLIDEPAVARRGIALAHAAEGNRDAVGEHTLAMLLTLMNRIAWADREVRAFAWHRERNRGYELGSACVGIVGYGNMGQAFARRLTGFGCQVIAYDKYRPLQEEEFAQRVDEAAIFERADVVSFHLPLTDETRGMVDDAYLRRFRHPIWLLNTARGEIVQLEALVRALNDGRVRGAGLDVLENEKMQLLTDAQRTVLEDLFASDRVLFTPHVAGWTHESYRRINEVLVTKIGEILAKKRVDS